MSDVIPTTWDTTPIQDLLSDIYHSDGKDKAIFELEKYMSEKLKWINTGHELELKKFEENFTADKKKFDEFWHMCFKKTLYSQFADFDTKKFHFEMSYCYALANFEKSFEAMLYDINKKYFQELASAQQRYDDIRKDLFAHIDFWENKIHPIILELEQYVDSSSQVPDIEHCDMIKWQAAVSKEFSTSDNPFDVNKQLQKCDSDISFTQDKTEWETAISDTFPASTMQKEEQKPKTRITWYRGDIRIATRPYRQRKKKTTN